MRIYFEPHRPSIKIADKDVKALVSMCADRKSTERRMHSAASQSQSKSPVSQNSVSSSREMRIRSASLNSITNSTTTSPIEREPKSSRLSDVTNTKAPELASPKTKQAVINDCCMSPPKGGRSRQPAPPKPNQSVNVDESGALLNQEAKVDLSPCTPNENSSAKQARDPRREWELDPLRKALENFLRSDDLFQPDVEPFQPKNSIPDPASKHIIAAYHPKSSSKHSVMSLLFQMKNRSLDAKEGAQTQTESITKGPSPEESMDAVDVNNTFTSAIDASRSHHCFRSNTAVPKVADFPMANKGITTQDLYSSTSLCHESNDGCGDEMNANGTFPPFSSKTSKVGTSKSPNSCHSNIIDPLDKKSHHVGCTADEKSYCSDDESQQESEEGVYSHTFMSYNSSTHSSVEPRSGNVCDESKTSTQYEDSFQTYYSNSLVEGTRNTQVLEELDEQKECDQESDPPSGQFLQNNAKGCAWVFDMYDEGNECTITERSPSKEKSYRDTQETSSSSDDEEDYDDSSFLSE